MAKKSNSDSLRSRRKFLGTVAAGPLLPSALSIRAGRSQENRSGQSIHVDAMAEIIRLRFGSYMASEDLEKIKRGLERMLRNAEAISKVKLTNSNEPDFMFHPHASL